MTDLEHVDVLQPFLLLLHQLEDIAEVTGYPAADVVSEGFDLVDVLRSGEPTEGLYEFVAYLLATTVHVADLAALDDHRNTAPELMTPAIEAGWCPPPWPASHVCLDYDYAAQSDPLQGRLYDIVFTIVNDGVFQGHYDSHYRAAYLGDGEAYAAQMDDGDEDLFEWVSFLVQAVDLVAAATAGLTREGAALPEDDTVLRHFTALMKTISDGGDLAGDNRYEHLAAAARLARQLTDDDPDGELHDMVAFMLLTVHYLARDSAKGGITYDYGDYDEEGPRPLRVSGYRPAGSSRPTHNRDFT